MYVGRSIRTHLFLNTTQFESCPVRWYQTLFNKSIILSFKAWSYSTILFNSSACLCRQDQFSLPPRLPEEDTGPCMKNLAGNPKSRKENRTYHHWSGSRGPEVRKVSEWQNPWTEFLTSLPQCWHQSTYSYEWIHSRFLFHFWMIMKPHWNLAHECKKWDFQRNFKIFR